MKTTQNSKRTLLSAIMFVVVFVFTASPAFADHADTGNSWTEASQEFYCHPNLTNLDITDTVTDSTCDIIRDSAADWNNVANSNWKLTESQSPAINFESGDIKPVGLAGKMNNFTLFGTIITANVIFNTGVSFGDSTVDEDVIDIYTIVKHEMGHLPTMYHNKHSGEQSISVMREGREIGYNAQRSISSSDASELAGKY